MIAYINGIVAEVTQTSAVLEVGGLGYEVLISPDTAARLGGRGEEARLYTYLYVREDQLALYGFLTRDELELFKKLITVSGVGPKVGLAILSAIGADDLRFAILSGDIKTISRAPGVGKKTAERLILDLRDKLEMPSFGEDEDGGAAARLSGEVASTTAAQGAAGDTASEAAEALVVLGYARTDALKAVRRALNEGAADTEAVLKAALKYLL